MRIRTFGDPVLRQVASPVKHVGPSTRRLAAQMVATMRRNKGVGLAAPQVGVASRVVVVDVGEGLHVLVNPKVTAASGATSDWEGCLSFPGLLAEIERAETVTVEHLGLDGRSAWMQGQGYLARALQHEIDHLDGVVILDRAKSVERIEPADVPDRASAEEGFTSDGGIEGPSPGDTGEPEDQPVSHPLRVAFLGTPDFARPTLEALMAAGHNVVGVVTQPDRPAGRGGKLGGPSAVKRTALAFGLPVWQGTASEARASLAAVLRNWRAEVGVVVAYGVILPPDVLRAPRLGLINLHASLLPDYRGSSPIQRAIMDGRSVSGVTVIKMDEGVDTGDILAQREVRLTEDETGGSLHDRLAPVGATLILHALCLMAEGRTAPRPQPRTGGLPAPRLGPNDEVIDWRKPAEAIARQVRALVPVPGAHTVLAGRRIKVWQVEVRRAPETARLELPRNPRPGEVVDLDGDAPVVATGKGDLVLRTVQPAGRSRMSGGDFVNGYRVEVGDQFEGSSAPCR